MKKLNFGDKIGIISTARKINLEELEKAINIFNEWGLKVCFGANLFNEENQFSGTVEERASDLQLMLDDDTIKAIICARGGYGTVQIIDKINFSSFIKNHKWIVGYSDVTVLHSHLHNFNIPTIHATMPINFKNNTTESIESLKNALFGINKEIKCPSHRLNVLGKVKGQIVGGNLSILYSLLGSDSDIETDGKILFIEDLDEYLYHIDRMMINLKRNGKLANIKAIIIGGMTKIQDNDIPFGKSAEEIILDHVKEYKIPACFGFPSGHIDDNRCIKFGIESVLEINKNQVILSQNQ
tara:strand:- start:237 stop:1127 length:891 start_codon:yes stop_codon:yes gene_type:complete